MSDTPAVPSRPASRQIGLSITVLRGAPAPGNADHVLTLGGELKARNSFAAADALAHAISEIQAPRLVLELSGITFCDLSSVRMLDNARGVLDEGGRTLVLRNPPAIMLELLQILGLAEQFVVEQQVD